MTERLDRIEAGIEQLNATINVLVTELISPAVRQSRANYEELQEVRGVLSETAQRQAESARRQEESDQQIARNTENITRLESAIALNEQRFNILVEEMRADRAEARAERRAARQANQALLMQLATINSDVDDLSDRVDGLEAS